LLFSAKSDKKCRLFTESAFSLSEDFMHILMVSARYLPFIGGIETHIDEVATRMIARGHRVTILTTDPTASLQNYEINRGLRIKRVKAWPKKRDYYFSPGIYREVLESECDIIHFQGWNNFVPPIGMLAAIRRDIPFVLTFHSGGHSSRLRNSIRGIQCKFLAPLVKHASHLIGVSTYEAEFFAKRMRIDSSRFSIVPNGASLPTPSNPQTIEPHLVLSVGRLERYKGHQRVIEAFPVLLQRLPDARLTIVGSGPYEGELRNLVRDRGLGRVVGFVSIPSHERQPYTDLLCSAGLVVLLSDYEAHPIAVMEALSVHRPVLVSDTSGLRELAQKGLCHSVSMEATPTQVAEAIIKEFETEYQSPEFSLPDWDDCTRQLLTIYEKVLNLPIAAAA
jgi:glycosyltransferase involved in cell wall biosynthesis